MLSELKVQAVLPVTDLARARGFYENVLGLTPHVVLPAGSFYACGDDTLLAISKNGGTPNGDHTNVAFLADDVPAEVETLRARGVAFEEYDGPGLQTVNGIARRGPITGAWFKDSEGNLLGVLHLDPSAVTGS